MTTTATTVSTSGMAPGVSTLPTGAVLTKTHAHHHPHHWHGAGYQDNVAMTTGQAFNTYGTSTYGASTVVPASTPVTTYFPQQQYVQQYVQQPVQQLQRVQVQQQQPQMQTVQVQQQQPQMQTVQVQQQAQQPVQLRQVQQVQQVQEVQQQTQVTQLAPVVEHVEKATVVHEKIRTEELEEIQPVIYREHNLTEVRQMTQPIMEGVINPLQVCQQELASETRATVQKAAGYISPPIPLGSSVAETTHQVVEKTPIILETQKKKIIEEVQPVLYKNVLQPVVIKETKPIYERVIEAPVIFQQTLPGVTRAAAVPSMSIVPGPTVAINTEVQRSEFVEKVEKPTVVHQKVRTEELEEIQPVIHREYDLTEVRQMIQPITEGIVQPMQVLQRDLAAETRATVQKAAGYISPAIPAGSLNTERTHKLVELNPIICETEKKRIIEEIQPIVYKDVLQPVLIRETKNIFEKIIEAPVIFKQTLAMQYRGLQNQAFLQQQVVQQVQPIIQARPVESEIIETTTTTTTTSVPVAFTSQ